MTTSPTSREIAALMSIIDRRKGDTDDSGVRKRRGFEDSLPPEIFEFPTDDMRLLYLLGRLTVKVDDTKSESDKTVAVLSTIDKRLTDIEKVLANQNILLETHDKKIDAVSTAITTKQIVASIPILAALTVVVTFIVGSALWLYKHVHL